MNQKSIVHSKPMVLVVGGAGFIGSCVNKMLHRRGYRTIVLDNLSKGRRENVREGIFIEGELGNKYLLKSLFEQYTIDVVMHFAAHIDVGESVRNPAKYYTNNVMASLHLLDEMISYGIDSLVFSSTAAIFGYPLTDRIAENHPCHPINPYGKTKWMIEQIMEDYAIAYGLKYCCLRYFNAAGGDPEGKIKNVPSNPTNLIPKILQALEKKENITVYGIDYPTPDGTCIRDYIHIEDLAVAHILAMERLLAGGPSTHYNLGNGKGYSVYEVIAMIEQITGNNVSVYHGPRRVGDPPILLADPTKAKKDLGWEPRYSLEEMVLHAWQSFGIRPLA